MLPIHFLKRYFPNTPDWLLGGVFLVGVLWLLVVPVEVFQFVIRQEMLPTSLLGRLVRSLYILGFLISTFLIPFRNYSSFTLSQLRLMTMILGLLISSPIYFILGALLATRKVVTITLGLLLLIINILFGMYILTIMFYSG